MKNSQSDLLINGGPYKHILNFMSAASFFSQELFDNRLICQVSRIKCRVTDSTDNRNSRFSAGGIVMGLKGFTPKSLSPVVIEEHMVGVEIESRLNLFGRHVIYFDIENDLVFCDEEVSSCNTTNISFSTWNADGDLLIRRNFVLSGSGFTEDESAV